jgi:TolB-like protein
MARRRTAGTADSRGAELIKYDASGGRLPDIAGSERDVNPRSLFERLWKRKLAQWVAAYVTAAAALFGTLQTVGEVFLWQPGYLQALFYVLLGGLFAAIVLSWYHGEKGRQRVTPGEVGLLAIAGLIGLVPAGRALVINRMASGGAGGEASLVVLPFTDTSLDREQEYLGEGIAEEVRRALSTVQGLPVARGASGAGRSQAQSATHVLDGSVQRIAEMIRITTRLTGPDGREIWSDRLDVMPAQLFDAEDRIAAAVARRLRLPAAGSGSARAARSTPVDPEAHDHYLRAEYALKQRTPASVIQAIAEYREAETIDPTMTAATAREAYAYGLFLDWGWTYPGLPNDELERRGLELSRRAIEQDSLSSEAWLAYAYLLQLGDPRELPGAADAFGRAVALDPTNPEAQHQYGQTLMALGRYAEAKAAYHAALAVEPDRPLTLVPLSAIALREGDVRAAERWADSAVALSKDAPYPWASRSQLRAGLGNASGARDDAERALVIDPSYEVPARSALAAALGALGQAQGAEDELDRARHAVARPEIPTTTEAYYLATAMLRLDHREQAIDVIESARPRSGWMWFYLQSPAFDSVRDDARFIRVVEQADPRTRTP